MLKKLKEFHHDQSGAITIIAAIGMVGLIGFAALAVDVGNIATVKSELQRAADAGALAGARALSPYNGSVPNWSNATTQAEDTVKKNSADGQLLTHCTISNGYWSLATQTMQSTAIVPTATDVAAVMVSINKTAGQNGGPLNLFFAPVFGKNISDITAQAVAFLSAPGSFPAGSGIFPVAVNRDLIANHWNDNPPYNFKIGSDYHYPEGEAGQWTSLKVDSNNVPTIRDLIDNGNPTPLNVGDNIWIQPGTKTTLYGDAAAKIGSTVILPVVQTGFDTHDWTPVLAFVAFKITDSQGGSDKYIEGHIVKNYTAPTASPAGGNVKYYGTFVPPKLVN